MIKPIESLVDILILYDNNEYAFDIEKAITTSKLNSLPYILNNVHNVSNFSLDYIDEVLPKFIVYFINDNNLFNKLNLSFDLNFKSAFKVEKYNNYTFILVNKNIEYNNIYKIFKQIVTSYKNKEKSEDNLSEPYSFKLPDWCYSKEYCLFDIQRNDNKKQIVFTFVDKSGKKKFHFESTKKNYFYVKNERYDDAPLVVDVSKVKIRFDRKGLAHSIARYEDDFPLELKHAVDYYYNRKEEEFVYEPIKLFWDIEVHIGKSKEFPNPLKAEHPVNAISYKLKNQKTKILILKLPEMDKTPIKKELYEKYDLMFFTSEKELLTKFFTDVRESNINITASWNGSQFDQPYITNRAFKCGADIDLLSPINETDINLNEFFKNTIYGIYEVDMLTLYKKMTQQVSGKEESYSLSYIATKVLNKDKVQYQGSLGDLYSEDINTFIEYSATDTELLDDLDTHTNHIGQKFELIKMCNSTWRRAETSNGLIDPVSVRFAKNNNKVMRNVIRDAEHESFSGAYVIYPNVGLYKWVVDFDFKSLYPSIICTWNLGHNTYIAKVSRDVAKAYIYNRDKLPEKIEIKNHPLRKSSEYITISKQQFIDFMNEDNKIIAITGTIMLNHKVETSFLTELLLDLMSKRDTYKKKMGKIREQLSIEDNDNLSKKLKQYEIIQYAIKVVMNSCFTSDTDVLTLDGIRNIKDVKVGDKIYSVNPKTYDLEEDEVIRTIHNKYTGNIYTFRDKNMNFSVTADHRMYLMNFDSNGPRIITAENLYLETQQNIINITMKCFDKHSNIDINYGFFQKHNSTFEFKKDVDVYCLEVKNNKNLIAGRYGKFNVIGNCYGVIANHHLRLYSLDLAKTITGTGQEALKYSVTHLDNYMRTNSKDINMNYLDEFEGKQFKYITYGDSVTKDCYVYIKYDNCVERITLEKLWNKINTEIIFNRDKEFKTIDNIQILTVNDNKIQVYSECVEIIRHKTNKKIYNITSSNRRNIFVTEDHSLINIENDKLICKKPDETDCVLSFHKDLNIKEFKIESKEEIEYDDYVYDLSVPKYERFICNDILVHNTDSMFCALGNWLTDSAKL